MRNVREGHWSEGVAAPGSAYHGRVALALLVSLGLIVAACGSDSADEAVTDDTTTTTANETTTTESTDAVEETTRATASDTE